jgi:hypothetical protein
MSAQLLSKTLISQSPQFGPLDNYIPCFTLLLSFQGFTPGSLRSKTQIMRNFRPRKKAEKIVLLLDTLQRGIADLNLEPFPHWRMRTKRG